MAIVNIDPGIIKLVPRGEPGLVGPPGAGANWFTTTAAAAAASINVSFNAVETYGRTTLGDGGGGIFVKVGSLPTSGEWFQSVDGAYWLRKPWGNPIGHRVCKLVEEGVKADYLTSGGSVNGSATDNLATLNTIFANGQSGDTFELPGVAPGTGYVGVGGGGGTTIIMKNYTTLRGNGAWGNLVKMTSSGVGEHFLRVGIGTKVEDVYLWAATGTTGGIAAGQLASGGAGSTNNPENNRLRHVRTTSFGTGRWNGAIDIDAINGPPSYGGRDLVLEDVLAHAYSSYGIRLAGFGGGIRGYGLECVNLGTATSDLWLTGSAGNPNSDVMISAGSIDIFVMERTGGGKIIAGSSASIWVDATCSSCSVMVPNNATGTVTNNGTACFVYAGEQVHGTQRHMNFYDVKFEHNTYFDNLTAGTSNRRIYFRETGTNKFQIAPHYETVEDRLYFTNGTESFGTYLKANSDSWFALSDERLKEGIEPMQVLRAMEQNPDVDFLYSFRRGGKPDFGPVAQRVHRVYPQLTAPGYNPDGERNDGKRSIGRKPLATDGRLWSVDTAKSGFVALQGVKELLDRVKALEEASGVKPAVVSARKRAAPKKKSARGRDK